MTDEEREKLNAIQIEDALFEAAEFRKRGNMARMLSEEFATSASENYRRLNECKRELYALGWRGPYPGDR